MLPACAHEGEQASMKQGQASGDTTTWRLSSWTALGATACETRSDLRRSASRASSSPSSRVDAEPPGGLASGKRSNPRPIGRGRAVQKYRACIDLRSARPTSAQARRFCATTVAARTRRAAGAATEATPRLDLSSWSRSSWAAPPVASRSPSSRAACSPAERHLVVRCARAKHFGKLVPSSQRRPGGSHELPGSVPGYSGPYLSP
mmetsp:Transcript_10779/g.17148  ORF Transcript_10779/g.17148 Transcript_10779/m.17148 type:complete len:205 (+) Transcript_10779:55-669(+)